jgi:hypothetical protein
MLPNSRLVLRGYKRSGLDFQMKEPQRSLLVLASIIYNHVTTGQGRLYCLEVGCLTSIEEHIYHNYLAKSMGLCF